MSFYSVHTTSAKYNSSTILEDQGIPTLSPQTLHYVQAAAEAEKFGTSPPSRHNKPRTDILSLREVHVRSGQLRLQPLRPGHGRSGGSARLL